MLPTSSPRLPAPGWYPDPSSRHAWRYWDGRGWTDHVASDGRVSLDPVPDWVRLGISAPRRVPSLPAGAIRFGLLGMLVSVALGYGFSVVGHLVRPNSLPVVLGVAQIGLWSGLIGTCVLVSRRLGTGKFVEDF